MKYLFILFIALSINSFAQTTVRGFVKSAEDGNAIPFAKVFIEELKIGANTDFNGFYSIPKVPAGNYTIKITSVEYNEFSKQITVVDNEILTLNVELKMGKILDEVIVSGEKKDLQKEVRVSVLKITSKDILRVPTTGGDADIATYFQTVPGVVSTGDQGGQVYVRGGTPIQNKILLDGMTIYNPFHSIGFFSVFETDLIRSADIYTGGFNAEYGGRISSIMDIKYRNGNQKRLSGLIGASPFTSKVLLEGPLSKKNGISFVFSSKLSLLEQTSKIFYPYINNGEGLPFNFNDYYGKITIDGGKGSFFNFFGFSFNDKVKYQAVSDLNWNSWGAGVNFAFVPQNSQLYLKGRINTSKYDIELTEDNVQPRTSSIAGFEMAFDFSYFLEGRSQLNYGFNFNYFKTTFNTFNVANKTIELRNDAPEAGAYFSYKIVKGRLVLEPSIRFQGYSSVGELTAEPRLGGKYNITENIRIKFAGGYFTQNYTSTTSDKDVVNLFYGFIQAPTNLPSDFTKQDGEIVAIENGLQKAWHAISGMEFDLNSKLTLNIEAYYKWFTQMSNINSNKIFDDVSTNQVPDVYKKDFITESGQARGVDVLLKYNTKKLYIWAVYSLSKVTRWDGFKTYYPIFDRRHNVNLVGSYVFGKNKSWEVTTRWNFGSGFPFKQTQGVGEVVAISSLNQDYVTSNSNELTFVYEDAFSGRLPTYHRLDLNIKKKFTSKKYEHLKWEVIAGVTNAYNRNNIFYVNRVTNEKVYQLPLMPSIALNFRF
ncbi:MAG TPA: TonB-dependent receptor [Crocinitomix sp.]|nr:TonB-dependent receptor [Crocinitomix sp.]